MAQIIPIFNDKASQSQEVTLDGTPYRFDFTYNSRIDSWFMSVSDREKNPLANGIKLVTKYEIITQFVGRGLPIGEMFVVDGTGEQIGVERGNIGLDPDGNELELQLIYLTKEEAEEVDVFIEANS